MVRPGCPRIPAPPGAGSVQLGGDGEGKAQTLQRRQDQGPGCPTCLFLSPESSLVYPVGGGGGSRNFPTCLSTLPITLSSSPGPSPPLCSSASGRAPGAQRPAVAPGRRELPAGKVSSSSARFPTPRAGPPGAASSALRGCLSSRFRGGRCCCSCHSKGCDPARPPASHGPHQGLIGSPNPRPCACSRRHLPLARGPGPRLPHPSPPWAAAAPGTR